MALGEGSFMSTFSEGQTSEVQSISDESEEDGLYSEPIYQELVVNREEDDQSTEQ